MAAPHHVRNIEPISGERTEAIRELLPRILASPAFVGSKRSQQFLEYVVDHALRGETDALRERMLGVELFGKAPGYDTATDAIVRVKANEVRKRLVQYYQNGGSGDTIRIELPAGSYTPVIHWTEPIPRPLPARRRARWPWMTVAAVIAVAAAAALTPTLRSKTELDEFWSPMMHTSRPILICLGQSEYFLLTASARRDLDRNVPFTVNPGDITRLRDGAVSSGMLHAVLSVNDFLSQHARTSQVAWGSEVRFTELRDQNVILIGAFNNPWTLDIARSARFTFEREDLGEGRRRWKIQDQTDRSRSWSPSDMYPNPVQVDYAIVTRIFDRARGRVVVSAAGVNQYGTEVAGDFLKDAVSWKEALRSAPKGWQTRNLQVVLRTDLAGETPVRTQVVATHYW